MIKKMLAKYLFDNKDKILIKNVIIAFAIRGFTILISFFSLPIYIRFFNNQSVLGVWYTVLGVLTWFLTFDLGIGNGLRNKLVVTFEKKDLFASRSLISSAYFQIGIISVIFFLSGIVVFPLINWNILFNIDPSIVSSDTILYVTLVAFSGIVLQFFLRIINFILYSMQKSGINNILALVSSIIQLLFVLFAKSVNIETNMKNLSLFFLLSTNLPLLFTTIYVFVFPLRGLHPRLRYLSKNSINQIMTLGGVFFWNQIMYMAIVQTDSIAITFFYGPENVVEYNVYFKLFSIAGTLFTLSLTPLWSAVTKALAEMDYKWIRKYLKLLSLFALFASVLNIILIPFIPLIFRIWLGDGAIEVIPLRAIIFAFYGGSFIIQSVQSTFACGLGKMKLQGFTYTIGLIVKVVSIFIINHLVYDWIMIITINSLFFITYSIIESISISKFIKLKQLLNYMG